MPIERKNSGNDIFWIVLTPLLLCVVNKFRTQIIGSIVFTLMICTLLCWTSPVLAVDAYITRDVSTHAGALYDPITPENTPRPLEGGLAFDAGLVAAIIVLLLFLYSMLLPWIRPGIIPPPESIDVKQEAASINANAERIRPIAVTRQELKMKTKCQRASFLSLIIAVLFMLLQLAIFFYDAASSQYRIESYLEELEFCLRGSCSFTLFRFLFYTNLFWIAASLGGTFWAHRFITGYRRVMQWVQNG